MQAGSTADEPGSGDAIDAAMCAVEVIADADVVGHGDDVVVR